MFKRLVSLLILVPIGVVLIAIAVSNRQAVAIAVPPYLDGQPLYSVSIPLFFVLFAVLLLGMIVGSLVTWIRQGRYRKEARETRAKVDQLSREADAQKAKAEAQQAATAPQSAALLSTGTP